MDHCWLNFMMATISSVVVQLVDTYNNANKYITLTMLIVALAGFNRSLPN